jgi:GalNAc5-diNAcBac-PP-undecaprenol beta-1,3-glucosyltransferase
VVTTTRRAPLITVIIPTHDHASTLDLAVNSVLHQSLDALEVVIIGDGVGDDTRDVVSSLVSDRRVRFLDTAKSPSRAELVRHRVICEARTPYVCYMGDDDLMLSDHLESTVEQLQSVDFTHPLPAFIKRDGSLGFHLTDMADSRCAAWHLRPGHNAISLTGVGHRLDAYLALPEGWREPPPGTWSDHYMWQQWFRAPSLRFSTGDRVTMLKFTADARQDMAGAERRTELKDWLAKSTRPGFASTLTAEAGTVVRRQAIRLSFDLEAVSDEVVDTRKTLELRQAELTAVQTELTAVQTELTATQAELTSVRDEARVYAAEAEDARTTSRELQVALDAVRGTRTWRLHDRLARWSVFRWLARL